MHDDATGGTVAEVGAADRSQEYWRRNVRYLAILLTIWAAVSFGAGIVWADALNRVRIPGTGFQLGFWFAQQGSIYVFLVLIVVYVRLMNRLDLEMGVEEEPLVGVASRGRLRSWKRGARADSSRGARDRA